MIFLSWLLLYFTLVLSIPVHDNNVTEEYELLTSSSSQNKEIFPTISQAQFDQLLSIAQMAKISYCTVSPFFTVGKISDQCQRIQFCLDDEHTTEIVEIFRPDWGQGSVSGTGFVAVNHKKKEVFLVFRGSCSPGDWMADFSAVQSRYLPLSYVSSNGISVGEWMRKELKPKKLLRLMSASISNSSDTSGNFTSTDISDQAMVSVENDAVSKIDKEFSRKRFKSICGNCKVHFGVFLSHALLFPSALDVLMPYLDEGYNLTVTGHSLGGGYAQLAGIELQYLGYSPRVVSFGQLRVGNPEMNSFTDKLFDTKGHVKEIKDGNEIPHGSFARVYQTSDVVPILPPFRSYTHSGLAFGIRQISLPQSKDVVEFRGKSNNHKNERMDVRWEDIKTYFILYQHINYLTRVSFPCNDNLILGPADAWKWPVVRKS